MTAVLIAESYAKINLFLEVIGRRADGFHDIETVFQTIELHDSLRFEACGGDVTLTCSDPLLECGDSNLVIKAARMIAAEVGVSHGARIHLDKRIPMAAGLAGGSGNAAATLLALNTLWDTRLSLDTLAALALRLGSDVPYCLTGGTMLGLKRGEVLSTLAPLPETWFVLVHPAISISAARAYTSPHLRYADGPVDDGRTEASNVALRALYTNDYPRALFNRLEGPIFIDYPEVADVKRRLLEAGCLGALMSGSGSTVFGVCASEADANRVASHFAEYRTTVAQSIDCGVRIVTKE